MSAPSAGSPTAGSASYSSGTTGAIRPPTPPARDSAITFSIAVQHGADPETIRSALCRDADGTASRPLGAALDPIAEQERG